MVHGLVFRQVEAAKSRREAHHKLVKNIWGTVMSWLFMAIGVTVVVVSMCIFKAKEDQREKDRESEAMLRKETHQGGN